MIRKALAALGIAAVSLVTAPAANAQVLDCKVQGILVIVAIAGPVTVCSVDTDSNTTMDPSLQLNPHILGRAPQ